jgi:hypothetical protein
VHESDLRELFRRQAATDLLPAPISIPAVRRTGRSRLFWRRAGTFGSPILAAAAVIAIVLAVIAASPRQPAPGSGLPAAPRLFNPLVPYAAVTWYPYQPGREGVSAWHTALLLTADSRSEITAVVLYPAGWCTMTSASLSCGSTEAGTRVDMTVRGSAPDVQGQPAYWTRYTGGNLKPLRPQAGHAEKMVAFQYARGGWAVVESTGTPADVTRIAGSLQYGQTSRLRFPFRLTSLPRQWSEVLLAQYVQPGPDAPQSPSEFALFLGSPATRPGTAAPDLLTMFASTMTQPPPRCRTSTKTISGPGKSTTQPAPCSLPMINGHQVVLNEPPVAGKQTLLAPGADGLYVSVQTDSQGAPLSPSEVFASHLQLLGPDTANWTTSPGAGTRLTNP